MSGMTELRDHKDRIMKIWMDFGKIAALAETILSYLCTE